MKIPTNINKNFEGQYCLHCHSTKVERIFKDNKTYYFCENCKKTDERSLVIDNGINWWVDEDNNYWHESVGVLILNEKNQLLSIMRSIYPFAYALPAGHVDKNEEPLTAMQREVKEEIGLDIPKEDFRLIKDFQLPGDSCRRGSDHHLWHLYMVNINSSKTTINLNDEANSYSWLNPNEIAARNDINYPLKYISANFIKEL